MPSDEERMLSDRLEVAVKELGCSYKYDSLPEKLRQELEQRPVVVEFLKSMSGARSAIAFLRFIQK